jgi:putative N6-adenine-specific DNA methylase
VTAQPPIAFAVVTPGLEAVLAAELRDLGIPGEAVEGGVTFAGTPDALATVHLWSRVAGRVLVRLGRARAGSLDELATGLRTLGWKPYAIPRQPIEVEVASTRSRLHAGAAVERKVAHAITDALRGPRLGGGRTPREPLGVWLRIVDDVAQVSVDASGELLHRRGWREATAKAPIRENLAAAILRLSGWTPGTPLVDPFCGAGTFVLEAAREAAGLPPRLRRTYAFERWPAHDAAATKRAERRKAPRTATVFLGADREEGAIRASTANARRAGVDVPFVLAPFEELAPPGPSGVLVANLPYGRRVEAGTLERTYRAWGARLRSTWGGWTATVVVPNAKLLALIDHHATIVARFSNGGIPVVVGRVAVP